MPPSKNPIPTRKHCERHNTPGHSHYLTFSCFRRQPFLSKDRSRQWLADAILRAQKLHHFRLLAYVFMPEHVHLLIRPTEVEYDISDILTSIKVPVARKARRYVLENAPDFLPHMLDVQHNGDQHVRFWQRGGGYDRNIFSAEELWEKILYIHLNPVRRGLVTQATDWIWSSATDFAGIRCGPLAVARDDLPWLER
jgi:putative transposase